MSPTLHQGHSLRTRGADPQAASPSDWLQLAVGRGVRHAMCHPVRAKLPF